MKDNNLAGAGLQDLHQIHENKFDSIVKKGAQVPKLLFILGARGGVYMLGLGMVNGLLSVNP